MSLERMRVAEAVEQLAVSIEAFLPQVRQRAPLVADHVARSALSVELNTAEGIAAYQVGAKLTAYDIARKECNELRAALRKLARMRVISDTEFERAHNLATVVVAMLTRASIAVEKRKRNG